LLAHVQTEDHPMDPSQLGEYAVTLQRHGAQEAARAFPDVARHLADGCSDCESDLQELLEFARADVVASDSPSVADPRGRGGVGGLARFVATLQTSFGAAGVGVRGERDARTLVYTAGPVSITLTSQLAADDPPRVSLNGAVVWDERDPGELAGARVTVTASDGSTANETTLDSLASFAFDNLLSRMYAFEVAFADRVIRIDEVRLTE
jgi:hypothetical protein